VRKSLSLTWLTLVAGLVLGVAGLPNRALGHPSVTADRSGVEQETPVPSARTPVHLRLAPSLRAERGNASGTAFGALAPSAAELEGPSPVVQSGGAQRRQGTRSTPGYLRYFPTGPPLSM